VTVRQAEHQTTQRNALLGGVGMAWEQTLAWTLMAIMGIWGAGTLLSFAVNRQRVVIPG
jgi:hypothetical protein